MIHIKNLLVVKVLNVNIFPFTDGRACGLHYFIVLDL